MSEPLTLSHPSPTARSPPGAGRSSILFPLQAAASARPLGHIAQLWRYPVKSMGGERCAALQLTPAGILGDRLLAFSSADAPTGKPLLRAAQRASMLRAYATIDPSGETVIHIPHHPSLLASDPDTPARLSEALGLPPQAALRLLRSPRPLTDVRPVSLHSLGLADTLARELDTNRLPGTATGFNSRRLRSNILLHLDPTALPPSTAFPEDALAGRTLLLGDHARLQILERIPRCRIVSLDPEPTPGRAPSPDPHLLPHLARTHNGRAGIYARTLTPGALHEGDPVFLLG